MEAVDTVQGLIYQLEKASQCAIEALGHPIEFHLNPRMLIATFIGATVIVMVAAFIPARRATQINVVEALHYE